MIEDFFKKLCELYDFKEAKIQKINIVSTNKIYRINCKKGTFLVKQINKFTGFDHKTILAQIEITNHLKKKNVKTIQPIKNIHGEQLTKIHEEYFLVYKYYELDDYEKFTEEEMDIAIEELSKFHNAMKTFKFKENKPLIEPLERNIDSITAFTEIPFSYRADSIINLCIKNKNKLGKKILKEAPLIKETIIRIIHLTWNKFKGKKSILHYDFSPDNIFFSKKEFLAISDFDFSHRGYVEVDVVKAARFWATRKDNSLDIIRFKRFIYQYNKFNKISMRWDFYYGILLWIVLRRLIYAIDYTITNKAKLEFLIEKDLKTIKFLMNNKNQLIA